VDYSPLSREKSKKISTAMLIGELSKRSGLTRDTIRFYEKHGLIAVGRKERRYNNYKEYSEETFRRLMSIKLIKSLGFTLNEVSEVLDMMDAKAASCDNMIDKFADKVERINDRIEELINMRNMVLKGLHNCQSACCTPANPEENCTVLEAQV
jgi:DNA-binding transcriptional MerR regulator